MKILQISSVNVKYPGGTEKVVLELSKELSKVHDVTILQTNLYEETTKYKKRSKIGDVEVITCKNDYFLGGFGYSKEFKKVLKDIWKDYDLIHVHGHGRFTTDFTVRFIKRRKPLIYTAHGFFHNSKNGKIKRAYNKLFKTIAKNVSYFTALTEVEKIQYLNLGIKENKIKIIPNWINLNTFKIKKNPRLKRKVSGNKKVILYVGGVRESKGLQHVCTAITDLDVLFLIIGRDAGYKKHLQKQIDSLNITNKVKFLGALTHKELLDFFSISDVFVLFSEWEGFGIVLLESMAAQVPVIGSDRGAIPHIIKHNYTGLISKFKDIEDLKRNIKKMLYDEKLRKKIIENSKKFVKTFDYRKIIKYYEKLYKDALHFSKQFS